MIIRKIKSAIKLIKGGRFGAFWDKMPFAKQIISSTNLLPHPQNYKYILLGGHGLGMTAVVYYLEKIGAKPKEIWSYEIIRPFYFYREFDGMILDKVPLNNQKSIVLKTCSNKVPIYQIVRDPISVIKSNVNVTMFHSISMINNKNDAKNMLIDIINNISHLMFYFASMRELVDHLKTDITYLTMNEINDSSIKSTLDKFAKKLKYKIQDTALYENESAIKGSIFPRCFPHTFYINDTKFTISTISRLIGGGLKEIDMNSDITKNREHVKEKYFILKDNIICDKFPQYPIVLTSFKENIDKKLQEQALQETYQYIDYVIQMINKHNKLCFNEDEIINFLLDDKNNLKQFSQKLAEKIDYELYYIKKENPEIFNSFIYTKKFLYHFNKGEL